MRFLVRRLEAFNRDELPAWRGARPTSLQVLLFVPRLVEFLVMYTVGLCALAAILLLMAIGWLTGLDRKTS
ncbi:hypothetical protein AC244_20220 [Ensifer adhaerens]|uniref:Uncharacterized protein n=1 Tax=Ensifer adhaerens TaxID=106592 RepID=A0A0L8BQ87_ENSAD|nr:hypothetical protein [Ensifer adhaerens]KOF16882.1 hypothetical protein AC244_20220 [Ensifer adhaerens]